MQNIHSHILTNYIKSKVSGVNISAQIILEQNEIFNIYIVYTTGTCVYGR
jgi:hypothetical protein